MKWISYLAVQSFFISKDRIMRNPRTIWRPAVFQGTAKKGTYFEGWFYKIVDATGQNTFAFIPGIFRGENPKESHAFIMTLDAHTHLSTYHPFPVDEFHASTKELDIRIGENRFQSTQFELNLHSEKRSVKGRINLGSLSPWPVRFLSPGVMGWYAFVPFMQCYHGVLSFDHKISGELTINGKRINFDGGRGYIEKDWGQSFPSAYVWMQSNHFSTPGVSLMASVANIPWLRSAFRGFIVGLWMNGRLLRFTTYTGARLQKCCIDEQRVQIIISDKKYRLEIETIRTQGAILFAPYDLSMTPKVSETLGSTIRLKLYKKSSSDELIFDETGRHAGLDVNGNLAEIIT
jgi:hypothetical protein